MTLPTRSKCKKPPPKSTEGLVQLRVPFFALFFIMLIWVVFVFLNYYRQNPIFPYFIFPSTEFKISAFIPRLAEHLWSMFVSLCVFMAGIGIGSFFIKKVDCSVEEKIFFSTILGLGCLSILTFFIGLFGLLYKELFIIIIGAGVIFGVAYLTRAIISTKLSK